eukprot:scaffold5386_cov98-Isochrysis_galbana.AAC.8
MRYGEPLGPRGKLVNPTKYRQLVKCSSIVRSKGRPGRRGHRRAQHSILGSQKPNLGCCSAAQLWNHPPAQQRPQSSIRKGGVGEEWERGGRVTGRPGTDRDPPSRR